MASLTPKFWSHFHLVQIVLWVIMLPVSVLTGLRNSVPYLVAISILSLIYGEFGAWQAVMGERRADETDEYGED